ncbi:MAG: hypothetical protein PHS92_04900 [Candidatus Gracilibacteria bacterium]|nr:hypothetical protein [Candidatus Gracilibacteria bacterium]
MTAMDMPVLAFATGSKDGGGSGVRNLIEASHLNSGPGALGITRLYAYEIIGIISNHENGGVRKIADKNNIPFRHMTDFSADSYLKYLQEFNPNLVALSGWLKYVLGIPFNGCINIHPGPVGEYGGEGMHGHHVHEKIYTDWKAGKIDRTCVTMHFVTYDKDNSATKTKLYDRGPVIFQLPVEINPENCADENLQITPDSIGKAVNRMEHVYQPIITALVASGKIRWSGVEGDHVIFPDGYFSHLEVNLKGQIPSCPTLEILKGFLD